jgi:hypothetical protein
MSGNAAIVSARRVNSMTARKNVLTALPQLLQTGRMHLFANLVLKSGLAPGRGWRLLER